MKLSLPEIESFAKLLAFVGATVFFCFKLFSGFFLFNLSVTIKCERKARADAETDVLVITVALKKGDMSALELHDIRAKISFDGESRELAFSDIHRISNGSESTFGFSRKVALFGLGSSSSPFLNFVPGDEASFACSIEVPRASFVRIDLVVLGKRVFIGRRIGQWRSSAIVPPSESANPTFQRTASPPLN